MSAEVHKSNIHVEEQESQGDREKSDWHVTEERLQYTTSHWNVFAFWKMHIYLFPLTIIPGQLPIAVLYASLEYFFQDSCLILAEDFRVLDFFAVIVQCMQCLICVVVLPWFLIPSPCSHPVPSWYGPLFYFPHEAS